MAKHISRKIIIFKELDDGYLVSVVMQGYADYIHGERLFQDEVVLGHCKNEDLEKQMSFFTTCNHNIEIINKRRALCKNDP